MFSRWRMERVASQSVFTRTARDTGQLEVAVALLGLPVFCETAQMFFTPGDGP